MNVNELIQQGAFVSDQAEKAEITWSRKVGEDKSGKVLYEDVTFNVHIKRVSYGATERVFKGMADDPERSFNAGLIAETVLLGEPPYEKLTYEQAYQLDSGLALALIKKINEINRRDPEKK